MSINIRKRNKKKGSKGSWRIADKSGKVHNLTLKEKLFCEKFLDFMGNGCKAAMEVFDTKSRRNAAVIANGYLKKECCFTYINQLLEEKGYTDENVEKQHLFLLNQFANLSMKQKAVDMFYKKKGSYAPEKHEFSGEFGKLLVEISNENKSPVKK